MKLTPTTKRVAVGLLAAALPLSLAACSKGSSSSTGAAARWHQTLTMWTHNAGNKTELAAITAIVNDYNASQTKYKVEIQAFPQDSYNQSVVAAAAAKKLPCILDIDGPNVPNWAWAGYLAPLEGSTTRSRSTCRGARQVGRQDVLLRLLRRRARPWSRRKSILEKYGIRIPTTDQPVDEGRVHRRAEEDQGLRRLPDYPLDIATSFTGEWWPYAYSPFLQSFGGDLINRDGYKTRRGRAERARRPSSGRSGSAVWSPTKYVPLKSGADPAKDFMNGKTAILYNGSWTAVDTRKKFGKDILFLPPPDLGTGPKIGGGSWQWGISHELRRPGARSTT